MMAIFGAKLVKAWPFECITTKHLEFKALFKNIFFASVVAKNTEVKQFFKAQLYFKRDSAQGSTLKAYFTQLN